MSYKCQKIFFLQKGTPKQKYLTHCQCPSNCTFYTIDPYFTLRDSSIRRAPSWKSTVFADASKVKTGLPHDTIICANSKILLSSAACAIQILSASAATKALRRFASTAVDRRWCSRKIDRINRRSSDNASFHADFSRIFSMLRAGHRRIGCEPRSKTRRHSCSTGEWYPSIVGMLAFLNSCAKSCAFRMISPGHLLEQKSAQRSPFKVVFFQVISWYFRVPRWLLGCLLLDSPSGPFGNSGLFVWCAELIAALPDPFIPLISVATFVTFSSAIYLKPFTTILVMPVLCSSDMWDLPLILA